MVDHSRQQRGARSMGTGDDEQRRVVSCHRMSVRVCRGRRDVPALGPLPSKERNVPRMFSLHDEQCA